MIIMSIIAVSGKFVSQLTLDTAHTLKNDTIFQNERFISCRDERTWICRSAHPKKNKSKNFIDPQQKYIRISSLVLSFSEK